MSSVSRVKKHAKENGWTEPSSLIFPMVFTSLMLGFSVWRHGFDSSARTWAAIPIAWVAGVAICWFFFVVCLPRKWR
jgi:hypothetical protein